MHTLRLSLVLLAAAAALPAQDVVFRSDVLLVRVDVQVLARDRHAVTGLRAEDFELREGGQLQPIRNFANEEMPLDVLLLIDVSGSMGPHVRRMADAAHEALRSLRQQDRVGLMAFDRSTRVRLALRNGPDEAERELNRLLEQERFGSGTDITRALLDAAEYMRRNARAEARRAIVILTDDQTERDRDEAAVERALARADAVLSALLAPDAIGFGQPGQYPGGGRTGGTYPRSGGSAGGPLGDIILGRRGGYPGGGYPGGGSPGGGYPGGAGGRYPGGSRGSRTKSAGTAEIARASGGDSMPVDDARAFEDTIARLRQRYALHFLLPAGVKSGEQRQIFVTLTASAQRRYPDADLRYRRTYVASSDGPKADPSVVTQAAPPAATSDADAPPRIRRRPAVDQTPVDSGGPAPSATTADAPSASTPTPASTPAAQAQPADDASKAPNRGGWRRLEPGEEP
jgi:VWFA-related protein